MAKPMSCPLRMLLAVLAGAALIPLAGAAAIEAGQLTRPEGERHYLLAQRAAPGAGRRPLVIVLHGHGGSAAITFGKGGFNDPAAAWIDIAERDNVIVIAPDGWRGSDRQQGWNDCRADAPSNPGTDDVGFLSALIDKAIAAYGADPERIYVTGISNGGGMTYRAAIELGPRLAAAAALSALMPAHSRCGVPRQPVPMFITHGTDDQIAPYGGGAVRHAMLSGRGSGLSAEQSVAFWRELAALPATPVVTPLAHRNPSDPTAATRYLWGQEASRIQVVFLKIDKGGHTQPSIAHRMPAPLISLLGAQNGDVEFVQQAWEFFKDKRSPAAAMPAGRAPQGARDEVPIRP